MRKTRKSDHALAIFKAGVAVVPVVGGPLASLIGDYIPAATSRSVERSANMLAKRLDDLQERVDVASVAKDDFSELFKTCYLTIVRTHDERKLQAAVEIVVNALLRAGDEDKLPYGELEHFARCVESLTPGALDLLARTVAVVRRDDPGVTGGRGFRFASAGFEFQQLQALVESTDAGLLMGLVRELDSLNLFHVLGVPTVRDGEYANYRVELTSLGLRFVLRLLEDQADEPRAT